MNKGNLTTAQIQCSVQTSAQLMYLIKYIQKQV
jgi:hypothetical protein